MKLHVYDNVQAVRAESVPYRDKRRKRTTLKIGQRGTLVVDNADGTFAVQFEDLPALVIVPGSALAKAGHQAIERGRSE